MIKILFLQLSFILSFIGYWNTSNCISSNQIELAAEDQQPVQGVQQYIRDSINSDISVEQIIIQAKKLGYDEALIKAVLEEMLEQTRENNNDEASKKSNRSWYIVGGIGSCMIIAAIIYMLIRRHQNHQTTEEVRSNEARPANRIQVRPVDRPIRFHIER